MSAVAALRECDDGVLAERAGQGDVAAFTALMRRYNQRLFRTARGILHDDDEAEDAVQEAWFKVWAHLAGFRGESALSTWLTRIAANEALMRRRRNLARAKVIQSSMNPGFSEKSAMSSSASLPPDPADTAPGPAHEAWRAELRRVLERHIGALPDKYREVFMLRGVEGLAVAEVAHALGIPETTVRVRYLRARRQLQSGLKGLLDEHLGEAFSFAGPRCDRIVASVHARLVAAGVPGLVLDTPARDDVGGQG